MRFSVAAIAALASGASAAVAAGGSSSAAPSVTTEVVTSYETYCPEATSFVHGSSTYSVTKPTTLTLSGGSYTVTRPLLTSTVTYCNSCAGPTAPAGSSSASVAPSVAPVYSGSSVAVTSTPAPVAATPAPPKFTGGASHAAVGAGAGLAGLLGVAAFLL
ncbi:hypothetical protein VTN96DRAFT_5571 [Rasamsonia emersonii]|uniref:Clock-controlled protein 6 n=1 Tax=Rasamsonia emersonii (strain ATCC 16479 / CBS 393.64 / IMI 116815) TaxID=1408163 RepID=A0A0F4YX28_RASE3|nr:hypothetical protein T310_3174 [Rasamsonia emersonii CBS 393.64]KKA22789.1 hypothetical protein T310_3174 [Rasamsonia emersonii CBS 393.64]